MNAYDNDTNTPQNTTTSRRFAGVVLAALAVIAAAGGALLATPSPADAAPRMKGTIAIDKVERSQVARINRFRAARGLPRLRIDRTLTRTALWHARDMGRSQRFSHTDSRGRDPFRRLRAFGYPSTTTYRGENIAAGNADALSTYRQWLNSPPHRANWTNRKFRAIGIARVHVAGSPYRWYWVTTFGSRVTRAM